MTGTGPHPGGEPARSGAEAGGRAAGAAAGGGEGETPFRSGFVALIGRPNVGKSTLLNQLIGRKIAIMSDKPQTTRTRILGVLNRPGAQLIFVDTPGIHKPQHLLGQHMVRIARRTLQEVEVICWLVEASDREPGPGDRYIAEQLAAVATPKILVVNKIDQVAPGEVPAIAERFRQLGAFVAVHCISALQGVGVPELVAAIEGLLPEGPRFFPEDMITDQPEAQIMAELIREQILHLTREEVPHAVAVQIERVERTIAERIVVEEALHEMGLKTAETQTNFSWIDLGDHDEAEIVEGLGRNGVIVRAGTPLGGSGHIRVSYGTPAENLRFLETLRNLLPLC